MYVRKLTFCHHPSNRIYYPGLDGGRGGGGGGGGIFLLNETGICPEQFYVQV